MAQDALQFRLWAALKRLGFSLEKIRQLLDLYRPGRNGHAQIQATLNAGRTRLAMMDTQYTKLAEAITDPCIQPSAAWTQISMTPPES